MQPNDVEVPNEQRRGGVDRGQLIGGVVIAAIGVLLLAAQTIEQLGQYIPLLTGGMLVFAFLMTRQYGFLVPGGIVTGVGVGIVLVGEDPTGTRGPLFLVALGAGFVSIWLLGLLFRVPESHWWPLIPGGILTVVGVAGLLGPEAQQYLNYWPIVLVVIGVLIVLQGLRRRERA
ncbi:hypothetical protein BH24CHL7_BH24CHL7_07280 [soil metagenome]